eukprot:COSAG02_NODE_5267_length_4484_cov_40.310376_4_plen_71_part_01
MHRRRAAGLSARGPIFAAMHAVAACAWGAGAGVAAMTREQVSLLQGSDSAGRIHVQGDDDCEASTHNDALV